MGILPVLFFLFLIIYVVHSEHSCPTSTCGTNSFLIKYPFHLEELQQSYSCSFPGFNIRCSNQGRTIINLPYSGDFYVHDIDYISRKVKLYDPSNCLAGRLMSFNFSTYPFVPLLYENYTFFSCSRECVKDDRFMAINCLSNSTATVLATSSASKAEEMKFHGCSRIFSIPIPVSSLFQFEDDGFTSDLELAWNIPVFEYHAVGGTGRSKSKTVGKIILMSILIPIVILLSFLFCIACCLCLIRMSLDTNDDNPTFHDNASRAPRPTMPLAPIWSWRQSTNEAARPDDLLISTRTELLVIDESPRIPGPNGDSCTICLGEYETKDRVRHIYKCDHCFHDDCLVRWLQSEISKGTCPICRIPVM